MPLSKNCLHPFVDGSALPTSLDSGHNNKNIQRKYQSYHSYAQSVHEKDK